jgi:hypothetical protein
LLSSSSACIKSFQLTLICYRGAKLARELGSRIVAHATARRGSTRFRSGPSDDVSSSCAAAAAAGAEGERGAAIRSSSALASGSQMAAAPPQPPPSSNEDVRMRLQSEVAKYSVKFRETKKQQQDAEDPEMTARRLKNVQQVSVQIRPHRCLDRVHDMLEGLSSLPPRLKGTGRLLVRCLLSQPGCVRAARLGRSACD